MITHFDLQKIFYPMIKYFNQYNNKMINNYKSSKKN